MGVFWEPSYGAMYRELLGTPPDLAAQAFTRDLDAAMNPATPARAAGAVPGGGGGALVPRGPQSVVRPLPAVQGSRALAPMAGRVVDTTSRVVGPPRALAAGAQSASVFGPPIPMGGGSAGSSAGGARGVVGGRPGSPVRGLGGAGGRGGGIGGGASAVGGAADDAGGIFGRLLSGRGGVNPNATGAARYLNPRFLTTSGRGIPVGTLGGSAARVGLGGALRAAGPAGLGAAGATAINAAIPGDSITQRVLANAALSAGVGASVGSVVPGIGTAIGGLAGGIGGALFTGVDEIFGGGGDKKSVDQQITDRLTTAMQSAGLSPEVQNEVFGTYRTLAALDDSKEGRQAAFQAAAQLLTQRMQEGYQAGIDTNTLLASQAMAQEFMQPITRGMVESAQSERDLLNSLADTLPAEHQGVARAGAERRVASANRMADAYARQMQAIPQITALQLEQERQRIQGQQGLPGNGDPLAAILGG